MLAYKTELLDHTDILLHAKKWHKNKRLSDSSYEAIKKNYTSHLYTPNFFIRIGLFIFTCISASAANGLLMLFTGTFDASSTGMGIRFIIHGLLMLGVLEFIIKRKNIYKSGIDDALLYMTLSSLIGGFCLLFDESSMSAVFGSQELLFAFIALPFLLAAAIRYSDMLVAACTFLCVFFIAFLLISKTGEFSKYVMPFAVMFLSVVCYLQTVKYRQKENLRFWDSSLMIIELSSLILFYLAGNYFIVRTLSEDLFSLELQEHEDIPLAFIFYAYTALIPLTYIFFGLKNKNRLLLQSGLILMVASVLTFKYYFSLGHPEITMTIGGIIMIGIAWLSTNYFKTPKFGITYIEDKDEKALENFDAEALIIAQTFSGPQHPDNNNPEFGGGKFGGGGADSSF